MSFTWHRLEVVNDTFHGGICSSLVCASPVGPHGTLTVVDDDCENWAKHHHDPPNYFRVFLTGPSRNEFDAANPSRQPAPSHRSFKRRTSLSVLHPSLDAHDRRSEMTAALNERPTPFFPAEIVSGGSRSAFHRGPELTGLGVAQEVLVTRAGPPADSRYL
jgi:hypothetical protein